MTKENKSAVYKYIVGFSLSLLLTLAAFGLVMRYGDSGLAEMPSYLLPSIVLLAVVQLIVQLYYFLHLGGEKRPRWNLSVFLFMLISLLIVVLGSLWIMKNLDYNMMSGHETMEYIKEHPGAF